MTGVTDTFTDPVTSSLPSESTRWMVAFSTPLGNRKFTSSPAVAIT